MTQAQARHCSMYFTHIIPPNSHRRLMQQIAWLTLFYKWGHQVKGKWNNLLRVKYVKNDKAGFEPRWSGKLLTTELCFCCVCTCVCACMQGRGFIVISVWGNVRSNRKNKCPIMEKSWWILNKNLLLKGYIPLITYAISTNRNIPKIGHSFICCVCINLVPVWFLEL